jgi:methylated-DNA-[protein]-cysteine S-methyltransferase
MHSAPYATDWGRGWVSWDGARIVGVTLPGSPAQETMGRMPPEQVRRLCRCLEAYFAGRGGLPDGTEFARSATTAFLRRVYEVVCAIPAGSTMSYGDVAAAAGRPRAARAVGAAMAANHFAPVVPCHRVVGSDGALRGYGGGIAMKREMLAMEARR